MTLSFETNPEFDLTVTTGPRCDMCDAPLEYYPGTGWNCTNTACLA